MKTLFTIDYYEHPNFLNDDESFGNIGFPDRSLGFQFTHNFDTNLSMKTGFIYFNDFIWYIQDNDFMLFESPLGAVHSWVSFSFSPEQMFSLKLKIFS